MKWTLSAILVLIQLIAVAQNSSMYVALKGGLSIREKPDEKSKIVGKIPYGSKLSIASSDATEIRIITEGLYGYWTKVAYNQVTGYIVNSYLLSIPPPKAGITTMKAYLLQLSPVFGTPLIIKSGNMNDIAGKGYQLKKQLYKSGASCHEVTGYEYAAENYFIPNIIVKEAFLLVRLLPEFTDILNEKDAFPLMDKKYKRNNSDYDLKVEKEMIGDEPWIKKIHMEFSDGSVNTLEIFQIEGEVVISYSSGV